MATIFQGASTVLGLFLPFFMVIFVWVITYALLEKTQLLGDKKGWNSIISLVIGLSVLAVPDVSRLIAIILPWFFFLFLFFILIALGYSLVSGKKDTDALEDISKTLGGPTGVTWVFLVIGGIILALAAGNLYGDQFLKYTTPTDNTTVVTDGNTINLNPASNSYKENLYATLFHPAIVGMMAFLIIATLAIILLSSPLKLE